MTRALRLLPLLLLGLVAAPARAQPPVWVVHGPHATVVLFGSVHLLPAGLDWEPPRLKAALAGASDLWFEVPIDDATALAAAQEATRRGMLPEGRSLSDELDPVGRAKLARAADACDLPLDGLNKLRPWFAELSLSASSYRQYGAGRE